MFLFPSSVSSDVSHDIITILILQVHETEVQWNISLSSHCLNEIDMIVISNPHKFSLRCLGVDKTEIVWYIRCNFDCLWVTVLLEIIVNIVFIFCIQELVIKGYLSKSGIGLSNVTSS